MEQLKLVFQFKHKMLPTDLLNLFELNSVVRSSHSTRNVCNEGLFIPRIFTTSFGITSLRYAAPKNYTKAGVKKGQESMFTPPPPPLILRFRE